MRSGPAPASTGRSSSRFGARSLRVAGVGASRGLRRLSLVAGAVLGLTACPAEVAGPLPEDAGLAVVEYVIDGDTIDVRLDGRSERVRLIGVDTPESVAHDRPVQCYGAEASEFLSTLLPEGTEVRLERDRVARDRFDRLLAYVYRAEDDLLVNLALIEFGFADAVTFGDNEALYDTFVGAEVTAREEGRGLWEACGGPDVDIGPPPG